MQQNTTDNAIEYNIKLYWLQKQCIKSSNDPTGKSISQKKKITRHISFRYSRTAMFEETSLIRSSDMFVCCETSLRIFFLLIWRRQNLPLESGEYCPKFNTIATRVLRYDPKNWSSKSNSGFRISDRLSYQCPTLHIF